ncbi:MAG: beta-N-acetylhexosaminidase [Colwellia sp.]|nr:beta-N-acetylhexosaminidase [Colwellia sp.]MCW9079926.1 beta-N-acetylhexosaminidase [Colwellia sp.]
MNTRKRKCRGFFLLMVLSLFFGHVVNISAQEVFSDNANTVVKKNTRSNMVIAPSFGEIIPQPVSFKEGVGHTDFSQLSEILLDRENEELVKVANYFLANFSTALSNKVALIQDISSKGSELVKKKEKSKAKVQLKLELVDNLQGGAEAYQLDINAHLIRLQGTTVAGIFRGIQTLKQLLNPEIEQASASSKRAWLVRQGSIVDYPRFAYRGFMLDVSRHFYTVAEVKQAIDYLAAYKINIFHFHLTNDQGWRIEIPKWPRLTEVGSNSAVGQKTCSGCFYSLAEYSDIVQYANDRHITLIPEISVPGHIKAALASYPEELYCEGDKPDWPYTDIFVRVSSLCFGNEEIYQFFDDVIAAIAPLTTGEYIHVGGDETPKWVKHKDYADFMLRAKKTLTKHGKKMMGWTNDLGNVANIGSEVIGHHWSVEDTCCETTLNMAKQGSKIVLSPANKTYLDLKYDASTVLGLNWAGYNSLENSYRWDPATFVNALAESAIYGIEAPLWGETINSLEDAQYMIFPRLLSLAEVAWSPQLSRSWTDFHQRVKQHQIRLKIAKINFHQ